MSSKLKKGARVKFTRRNGQAGEGKVTETIIKNGPWVCIKCADGSITKKRPSECEVAA